MEKEKPAKKFNKEKASLLFAIMGRYIRRHYILFIVALSVILLVNVAFTIGWYLSPDIVNHSVEVIFYITQGIMFAATVAAIVFLILMKFKEFSDKLIALFNHAYAALLIAWATLSFCFDISLGYSPLMFLLVVTFVAGIFVIEPIFFVILEALAMIPISIVIAKNPAIFFGNVYFWENLALFIAFLLLIFIICVRNYNVVHTGFKIHKKLHELSYIDELTGLFNERSYIDAVTEIDERIDAGENVNFAVVLMDVNNLKATNDAYGHRYGCSLVVRCGHTLPTLFESSKAFHIGGDEFVVIMQGKDLEQFEDTLKRFDEAMLYSIVEYEGKQLIFSVARGYSIAKKGQHYKDVLQIADTEMYAHKKYLKEKYNMKGR